MNDHGANLEIEVLSRFVNAEDDAAADNALAEVYALIVEPVIFGVIRGRLGGHARTAGPASENIQDLCSEVRLRLIPILRKMRDECSSQNHQINNLRAYLRSVALNSFRQFLRNKYPVRLRLKNKIRYITGNHNGFALWTDHSGRTVCGLASWKCSQMAPHSLVVDENLISSISTPGKSTEPIDDNRRIIAIVTRLFQYVGKPVFIEEAVSIVGQCLGIRDPIDSDDAELLEAIVASQEPSVEKSLEDREALARLWQEIAGLPLRHRQAMLLNLRGPGGENAVAFFSILRIASMREIARKLEIDELEFAELWNRLPLDDKAIAERFELTRQQVINLRQSARSMLKRRRSS